MKADPPDYLWSKYECFLMSGSWDIPHLRNSHKKLWLKFHVRDGCTNKQTNEHTNERTERWKLYTPRHKFWGYNYPRKSKGGNANQRTSGPVSAHLTPSPGIYFNAFIYVYSPRVGADNLLGTKFWWQQKGRFSLPICCKFQNDLFEIWFYTHF